MADTRQGLGARFNFTKKGGASSWRRMALPTGAGGKRTVLAALETLAARPGFEVSGAGHGYGDLIELRGVVEADAAPEVRAEVEALVDSAGGQGAHAELAVFPLSGDVGTCEVWSPRKRKRVDFPPEAREVQADYRFIQRQLRESVTPPPRDPAQEHRTQLLEEARGWPARHPVGGAKDFGSWQAHILKHADASARPVLERLGREQAKTLVELARDANGSDSKWSAAARALGLSPGDLYLCNKALVVPLVLTSKSWQKQLGLTGMELGPVMEAVSRIAPDALSEKQRRQLLLEAREQAALSMLSLGRWCDVSKRLEGQSLEATLREALRLGTRPDAGGKYPGFARLAEAVADWSLDPAAVPGLRPWSEAEVRAAFEALVREGLPSALQKRIDAARAAADEASPPYGLEPRPAWELNPKRATKPTLRCEACDATLRPKAELSIPPLSDKHGARTVRIYECDACAEEEPIAEYVRLTVEPASPRGARKPSGFQDYPSVSEAKERQLPGFTERRYREFLKREGLEQQRPVQLGGYPHGVHGDEALIGVRCRHTETLLEFSPMALGLKLRNLRAAVGVCLKAGCKKPGVSDELAVS
jgi:hypothetical protein